MALRKFSVIILLFTFLSCLSGSLLAQNQNSVRLTDGWKYLKGDLGGIWEAVRPVKPGDPESVPIWEDVTLPHCFNSSDAVDPDLNYYQGPGWYRTNFKINNPYPGGRIMLHFEGSGQKTKVFVYTTEVGSHTGGYDEFTIDITDAVNKFAEGKQFTGQFGETIPIAVRCDNSRDLQMIPSDLSDFNLYGGLYRYVNLVYVPSLYIERIFALPVCSPDLKTGTVKISGIISSLADIKNGSVSIKISDPSGKTINTFVKEVTSSSTTRELGEFMITKPVLWSPESPVLYTCKIRISSPAGEQVITENFGFRSFEFIKNGPFMLNGKRLLLRGTHRHEDHAGVAQGMTEEMIRREMIMMKEMGVNFIRLGHYQQSRIVLDLCDSLGILVWEEIPWCRGGIGGDLYKEQARRMLTNMINQHHNHPSVIIWGLGNENDWPGDFEKFEQDKIRAFMTELNDLAHKLDPSRKTAIRRCAFCKDIVDVYSPSIWAGWYSGRYSQYKTVSEKEMKSVDHFLHVEWGGDSHARRHSEDPDKILSMVSTTNGVAEKAGDASLYGGSARVSKDGDWSESYICNLIDWHLMEQETMTWLTGTAYWPFKDFSTPIRPENPVPYVNQKGVVERDLTKKESYYVFQSYWTSKPMAHIYGHSWPVRWGDDGELKMIKVYSNCEEAELFLNGKSCGIKKRNSQDFPAAGLRWNMQFKKGENLVRVVTRKGRETVTDEISFKYQSEKWGNPSKLILEKTDQKADTVTIQVKLVDDKGVLCLDSRNYIEFLLSGDGKLIDNLGTSTGSRKVQVYNGRAIISVKTNYGKNIAGAKSDGLKTVFLDINTESKNNLELKAQNLLETEIISRADNVMAELPVTITSSVCKRSAGGIHDFYSEGDYWWPDPANPDGPYIQRDGMTNPDNFVDHRKAMIRLSRIVGSLASAYKITGDEKYVKQAFIHLQAWFADPATRMNPSLLYSQAIKGRFTGRGIGIIDTIQLMEVAQGIIAMQDAKCIDKALIDSIKSWFAEYLQWLMTHQYGKDEMNAKNNHGTCWVMQAGAFARLTGDQQILDFCRKRYKEILLPNQMATDGSFPEELRRTKPYGYSLFNLDAMTMVCLILTDNKNDLINYQTPDGRCLKKGIEFLYPFLADKNKWTYPHDVMYWENWPVAQPFLIFGAIKFNNPDWYKTWASLEHFPEVEEIIRNLPVRNPVIWFN